MKQRVHGAGGPIMGLTLLVGQIKASSLKKCGSIWGKNGGGSGSPPIPIWRLAYLYLAMWGSEQP